MATGARTSTRKEPADASAADTGADASADVDTAPPVVGPGVTSETPAVDSETAEPGALADAEVVEEVPDTRSENGTEYLNVSGGPLPYDEHSRIVADGEWTPKINPDPVARHYRDAGLLLTRTALRLT